MPCIVSMRNAGQSADRSHEHDSLRTVRPQPEKQVLPLMCDVKERTKVLHFDSDSELLAALSMRLWCDNFPNNLWFRR